MQLFPQLQACGRHRFHLVAISFNMLRWLCVAHRRSQVPVYLLLVNGHGKQRARKAAGCYGCACVYSMNRTIVSEAAGRRDPRAALKARRNSQSQTGSVTEFSYCNKEHHYPCTRVLYTGANLTDL